MKVRCLICDGPTQFNSMIGVYFCPDHGFETEVVVTNVVTPALHDNLNQLDLYY